jgi:hypothetical protein
MLFDTQSPNRRNAVRIIFAFLALLMGGGLVLFGIGTATNGGGILSGLSNNNTSSGSDALASAQKSAAKAAAANPKSIPAAQTLATASATLALSEAFDQTKGTVIPKKQSLVTQAETAWTNYLALKPATFDPATATQFVQIYAATQDYASAMRAQEARIASHTPNAADYALLAELAIVTSNKSEAATARAKALSLASTASQRKSINSQLDNIQKQVTAQTKETQAASGTSSSSSATPTKKPLATLPGLGG